MRVRRITNNIIAYFFVIVCILIGIIIAPSNFAKLKEAFNNGNITVEYSSIFENEINSEFPQKYYFVDINGLFRRAVFQREMNGVLRLSNGQETQIGPQRDLGIIKANAESVKKMSDWLNAQDIYFLYCQIPAKIDEDNSLLPVGRYDYSDQNADMFLQELENLNVNYLDIRECIDNDNIDRYSLFLNTEHHWSPGGAFYGFSKICDYLREEYGEEIPEYLTDINEWEVETYQSSSLGYYGQRTGWMFAGGFDDFSLIYPKWETRQSIQIPHNDTFREGSFYESVFQTDYLAASWRERGLYATYIGGDYPLVINHSNTAPVDKTLLIIIDSFGTILESDLTVVYKNVVAIDLRWVQKARMGKSAVDFVNEYSPDIVIIAYNCGQIGHPDPVVQAQFEYAVPVE